MQDTAKIILLIRNRDKNGLEALYAQYGGALYGMAQRMLSDDRMAEEVLQDVLLRIWDKIDQYDEQKGRFFTWMAQICRNMSRDRLRSRLRRDMEKTGSLVDNVSKVDQLFSAEQKVEHIGLAKLIGELSEDERLVLDMVYFKGYTHSEVADETGMPLGTVKTRLRRAIINLRKSLNIKV